MGTKKRTPASKPSTRKTARKAPAARTAPKKQDTTPPAAAPRQASELESKFLDSLISVVRKIRNSLGS